MYDIVLNCLNCSNFISVFQSSVSKLDAKHTFLSIVIAIYAFNVFIISRIQFCININHLQIIREHFELVKYQPENPRRRALGLRGVSVHLFKLLVYIHNTLVFFNICLVIFAIIPVYLSVF